MICLNINTDYTYIVKYFVILTVDFIQIISLFQYNGIDELCLLLNE